MEVANSLDSRGIARIKEYKLLIKKGIYPYEYMTDWDKFKETKLPPREAFYSKLNMSGVGNEDYEHANRVWKEFGLKDLGEYHDLYLKRSHLISKCFRGI